MKRGQFKGFITGILTTAIIIVLIGTATAAAGQRSANLNFMDIKITLDEQEVKPTDTNGNTVEPFAIDGTIYLPVRAAGKALGMDVNWDSKSSTVQLTRQKAALAESYGDTKVPRLERVVGQEPFYNDFADKDGVKRYYYDITLFSDDVIKNYATEYDTLLKAAGFAFSEQTGSGTSLTLVYKNTKLSEQVSIYVADEDGRSFAAVKIEPVTGKSSSTSSGGSSGTPSGGGNSGGGDDRNLQLYLSDKAALDATYQSKRPGLEAAVSAAQDKLNTAGIGLPPGDTRDMQIHMAELNLATAEDALQKCDDKYQSDLAALQSKYGI